MKLEYKAVEEKALEWNMSPGRIRDFCRKGKIKGAVKPRGVWLIPASTPNPLLKYQEKLPFIFTGTKAKIFDTALDLFVQNGFSNVTLKDIAAALNIRPTTIYVHFSSKQDILDNICGFFCHYYIDNRLSLADMEKILREGTVLDIITAIKYEFPESYRDNLFKSLLVLFQEKFSNQKAREITKKYVLDEGINYVKDVLNKGIEIGRFRPFDVQSMAVHINAVRLYVMHAWIVTPSEEGMASLMKDDQSLYQIVVKLLTDVEQKGKENKLV